MSMPTQAQSAEERKAVSDSVNAENLRRLSAEFQKDFERQEALVLSYLHLHPEKPRSFQKNGSTYYLKRIGDDGNPVYITTRSEYSAKHQPSDRPINLDPTAGGDAR
jgi:hypothetical protein